MNIRQYRKVDVAVFAAGQVGLNVMRQVRERTDRVLLISGGMTPADDARYDWMLPEAFLGQPGSEDSAAHQCRADADAGETRSERRMVRGAVPNAAVDDDPAADQARRLLGESFVEGPARLLGPRHIYVNQQVVETDAILFATPHRWHMLQFL